MRAEVKAAIECIESTLGSKGRIVVRPSGTEPLLRIMIEGEDAAAITAMADELAGVIAANAAHIDIGAAS
jgi:phosphoglucosamine mutase